MADTRPLAGKLQQAGSGKLTRSLARQTLANYFFAVSDMLGDRRFDEIYNRQIAPHMKGEHNLVCQFMHQMPRIPQRVEALYQILIEPFIAMRGGDDA